MAEVVRKGTRAARILDRDEIGRLLDAASAKYRPLLATAVLTGLRQGELLGLTWADIDFEAGFVHVRGQLDRTGARTRPKTPRAVRTVVMIPTLAKVLRVEKERAFARGRAAPSNHVFTTDAGTPFHWRNVSRRGLEHAVARAGLNEDGQRRLRFHDLRHCFASILISQGRDVVFVSSQLGHASPNITLGVYGHLWEQRAHADRARDELEAAFGGVLAPDGLSKSDVHEVALINP